MAEGDNHARFTNTGVIDIERSLTNTNEVVSITVSADAGTYDVTFGGQTATMDFDFTAAEFQAEFEALSSVGVRNANVTGGPGDATGTAPYVIEFVEGLGGTDVGAVTTDVTDLDLAAGAGTAEVAVVTTGAGYSMAAMGDPITKYRLPEDGAANGGRSHFYAQTGQKDILPEHKERRDTYPFIWAQ